MVLGQSGKDLSFKEMHTAPLNWRDRGRGLPRDIPIKHIHIEKKWTKINIREKKKRY